MSVVAEQLDFSRLPPPEALLTLSFKNSFEEAKARLVEEFAANNVPFNVEKLETDSGVLILRVNNWRELLMVAAVNRAFLQTLITHATGASLDHIAATIHFMPRMPGEKDDRFKLRIQLEEENKSGGRLPGYKREAMSVSLDVEDVGAWVDRAERFEPVVRLAIMAAGAGAWMVDANASAGTTRLVRQSGTDGAASNALVAAVQAHMERDNVPQATDVISVQSVSVVGQAIDVTLHHLRGPDPAVLRLAGAWAIAAMSEERRKPHRALPKSPISAAASVGGVERCTVNLPAADVFPGYGTVVHVTEILVRSLVTDG